MVTILTLTYIATIVLCYEVSASFRVKLDLNFIHAHNKLYANCHSLLPVWVAAAKESGLEEGMAAICDSQNGTLTINLKTLNLNSEINCD